MQSDIDKLLNSLPRYPNYMVMHFCDSDILIDKFKEFSKDAKEYLLFSFKDDIEDRLKEYKDKNVLIKYIHPNRPKYHSPTKSYDYLFVTSVPKNRESFFKKIYTALKNGAPIFIFLAKDEKDFAYMLESELIERNYVAINIFSVDSFLVISAKKMHGWSGS